jgi:type IV secretory pathway TrbD component
MYRRTIKNKLLGEAYAKLPKDIQGEILFMAGYTPPPTLKDRFIAYIYDEDFKNRVWICNIVLSAVLFGAGAFMILMTGGVAVMSGFYTSVWENPLFEVGFAIIGTAAIPLIIAFCILSARSWYLYKQPFHRIIYAKTVVHTEKFWDEYRRKDKLKSR